MTDLHIRCTRGHELWLQRLLPGLQKCPLYGCQGDVDFGDDGLLDDRARVSPRQPPPELRVALTPPRPGEPVAD